MNSEQLIEAVKKRTILYQSDNRSYKNSLKKEEAWKEVADEIGGTGKILAGTARYTLDVSYSL